MNHFFSCFEMFTVGSNYPNMSIGGAKGDVEKDDQGLQIMKVLIISACSGQESRLEMEHFKSQGFPRDVPA